MQKNPNLEKMRESLHRAVRGDAVPVPVESHAPAAEDPVTHPRGDRRRVAPRIRSSSLLVTAILLLVALLAFCLADLGVYREWYDASRILADLRDHPGDSPRMEDLKALATRVDRRHAELKSGLCGILAVRQVGMGPRESGYAACDQVMADYPGSWVSGHLAREAFNGPCDSCRGGGQCLSCGGRGGIKVTCPLCEGTGKCSRCKGAGDKSPGSLKNHGRAVRELDAKCLVCKGTGDCRRCGGQRKVEARCDACGGKGVCRDCGGARSGFSTVRVTAQYRAISDGITVLYPEWIRRVLAAQTTVRSFLPRGLFGFDPHP